MAVSLAPVDTRRKLKSSGSLLNVLCTFNLRPVSTGGVLHVTLICFEASVDEA